jgi:hypothetical protein
MPTILMDVYAKTYVTTTVRIEATRDEVTAAATDPNVRRELERRAAELVGSAGVSEFEWSQNEADIESHDVEFAEIVALGDDDNHEPLVVACRDCGRGARPIADDESRVSCPRCGDVPCH